MALLLPWPGWGSMDLFNLSRTLFAWQGHLDTRVLVQDFGSEPRSYRCRICDSFWSHRMVLAMDGYVHSGLLGWPYLECSAFLHYRRQHLVVGNLLHPGLPLDTIRRGWHTASDHRCDCEPVVFPPTDSTRSQLTTSHPCLPISRNVHALWHNLPLDSHLPPHPTALPHPPTPAPDRDWRLHIHPHPLTDRRSDESSDPDLRSHTFTTSSRLVPRPFQTPDPIPTGQPADPTPDPQTDAPVHPISAPPALHALHHIPGSRIRRLGQHSA